MKNKLTLLAIAFTVLSCSTDSENQEVNCSCGTVISKMHFTFPNFTVLQVKNDCTGEVKTVNLDGDQYTLNDKYCD